MTLIRLSPRGANDVTRWYSERKGEAYYKKAKKEGYRARSAYKLKQINDKFSIIKKGDVVVDLGSSPGGWTQVAVELVGEEGAVVGVDLDFTPPVEGATLLRGDLTEEETKSRVRKAVGPRDVDTVVSDMSPKLTGNYDRDQAESVWLAQHALAFARSMLKPGGNFLAKVFEGRDFEEYVEDVKSSFKRVKMHHPPASRKRSSEVYVIAQGYAPDA